MRFTRLSALALAGALLTTACVQADRYDDYNDYDYSNYDDHDQNKSKWQDKRRDKHSEYDVQLGPRPFFLVEDMDEGRLKRKLSRCEHGPFKKTDFSIGHRGAALQFPEHTRESYMAAAKMGAGILECDVTFTKDRQLVCRHSQCDLHTTTNILATDLADKCSQPFVAAVYDGAGNLVTPASASCCTSDITLAEFRTLKGKMDASNIGATTAEEYLGGTANWRTDLYADSGIADSATVDSEPPYSGTLLTHKESIRLFRKLGVKMTPELKSPSVPMPYEGNYTQEDYAQQMIDEYKQMRVSPEDVYPQSFNLDDIKYWIFSEPSYGNQAVYLDGRYDDPAFDHTDDSTWDPDMYELAAMGVKIIAPPMWMLLKLEGNRVMPSIYATKARAAGLDIITWTLERDGPLKNGGGWYHQTVTEAINNDGDTYRVLDVLARDVGVIGVFSDWPATTSYYANCMKLK